MRDTIERQSRGDQEAQVVKLGVLIVGSLYWDLKPPRPRWRAERLDCAHQEHVRVPIRYGRRSTKRGIRTPWLSRRRWLPTNWAPPSRFHTIPAISLRRPRSFGQPRTIAILLRRAAFRRASAAWLFWKTRIFPYRTSSVPLGRTVSEERRTTRHQFVCMGKTETWSIHVPAS